MPGIEEKLIELLSSPEGIKAIAEVAKNLLAQSEAIDSGTDNEIAIPAAADEEVEQDIQTEETDEEEEGLGIDPAMASALMTAMMELNSKDDRARLLYDLKPYLSESKHQKIDRAVSLLKLSRVAKGVLKSGDFKLF